MAGLSWVAVILSTTLGGISVVLLMLFISEMIVSLKRVVRIKGALHEKGNTSTGELLLIELCTNGVTLFRLPARLLLRVPAFAQSTDEIVTVLVQRIPGCNQRAVAEIMFALGCLSGLTVFVLTQQVLLALVCLAAPAAVARMQARKWLRTRREKLREQLPDALRGLGMCFMAGLSLEQSFDQTARECRAPLQSELRRTVDDLRTGFSIEESLDALDERLAMEEMGFVSVALEIQHRTGGSMREVLDSAADSMLASFDLSRSLEVQTSQARMSARIVSILPLALVLVLSVAMEGYLATFFSSPAGLFLLLSAVAMELLGIFAIRRILGIDLE